MVIVRRRLPRVLDRRLRRELEDRERAREVEREARAWWDALHAASGAGVPWEEAPEEAREATRAYVRATPDSVATAAASSKEQPPKDTHRKEP